MLPLTPTHALAIARTEEVQRKAAVAYRLAPAPTSGSSSTSVAHLAQRGRGLVPALRALAPIRRSRSAAATQPSAAARPVVCCA